MTDRLHSISIELGCDLIQFSPLLSSYYPCKLPMVLYLFFHLLLMSVWNLYVPSILLLLLLKKNLNQLTPDVECHMFLAPTIILLSNGVKPGLHSMAPTLSQLHYWLYQTYIISLKWNHLEYCWLIWRHFNIYSISWQMKCIEIYLSGWKYSTGLSYVNWIMFSKNVYPL